MTKKNQTRIIAEAGKQELFIIREFEAPRELVFKAFNDPVLLTKWLGSRDMTMEVEKLDNKTGGAYRFNHCDAGGNTYSFNGVIHDVTAPERIIRTFEFEGLPERGHVSLETALFDVLPGGRTKLTIQAVFKSVMDRDGMIQSGMERGVVDGHNRLDELLEKILVS
ncbi:MAG TPA: SRPBCC family protein [Bacteroidia bacterium]|nr:SRPBCC family protein [Bacteroidia bacterium]